MLLEFGFQNFFSFREGVSISLKLDANCPSHISKGNEYATVLGIKGANAAGKTQVLKALAFIANFCSKSFISDPEDELLFSPFFESKDQSEFYVEFLFDNIFYRYELTCTEQSVLSEVIYKKTIKKIKIFERKDNDVIFTTKQFEKLKQVKLRKNASIISTANQYELTELKSIYNFFNLIMSNVGYSGMRERQLDIKTVSKHLYSNPEILAFVNKFIAECDTGISAIKIINTKGEDGKDEFVPFFIHNNENKAHPITQHTESSGTKALYRNLPMYKITLDRGGLLILDEFDTHLHPRILPKLLGLFLDEKSNPKNAQIIFTTHNSDVLDLLGRYRIHLVNKRENESFALRLDEIPGDILRNDRSIRPIYQDGKIGGIPRI